MTITPPPKGAQAALRTIHMLKAFTADEPELTLSQLSTRLGLNKTTAHRLLAALQSETLVERNPRSGAYRLGQGTVTLGRQALAGNDLRTRTRPVLERLATQTGETATLELLTGDEVTIVEEVDGGRLVGAVGHIGTRWPAHATSTGKAILAWQSDIDAMLAPRYPKLTKRTLTDAAALRLDLRRARRRGYATAVDELELGFTAVAAAIREPARAVRAAVSLGGPTARLGRQRRKELGELLRDTLKTV